MKKSMFTKIFIMLSLLFTLSCYGQNNATIDSIQLLGEFFEENGLEGSTLISKSLFQSRINDATKMFCKPTLGFFKHPEFDWKENNAVYTIDIIQGKTMSDAKKAFAIFNGVNKEINGKFIISFSSSSTEDCTKIREIFFLLKSDDKGNLHLK